MNKKEVNILKEKIHYEILVIEASVRDFKDLEGRNAILASIILDKVEKVLKILRGEK